MISEEGAMKSKLGNRQKIGELYSGDTAIIRTETRQTDRGGN